MKVVCRRADFEEIREELVESGRIKPTLASLLATGTGTAAGGQKISREEYDAIIRKITASAETLSEMAQTLQRTFSAFKF